MNKHTGQDQSFDPDVPLSHFDTALRWVAWVLQENAQGKLTKIPLDPATGRHARIPSDPKTWGTRAEAEARWQRVKKAGAKQGGLGIVLGPTGDGHHLLGIDLDSCIDDKEGFAAWANEVIDRFATYTEISPSRNGVKLLFRVSAHDWPAVDALLDGKTRRAFVAGTHQEIALDTARFYAITRRVLEDTGSDQVMVVGTEHVEWLIHEAGPRFMDKYGPKREDDSSRRSRDESGSGQAFRFLSRMKREGKTYEEARAALLADQTEAGTWARERADERQIRRAWNAIGDVAVKSYDLVWASDVVAQPVNWLWPGRLFLGGLSLTTGIPGMGKSQIECSLAASITTGRNWPDGERGPEPGYVIMVTGEDSLAQTVVPRLMAAKANRERVVFLRAIRQDDKKRMFLLGEDIEQLERMINEIRQTKGPVLHVSVDPITAFMGKVNSHSTTDVRGQLGPLTMLAERTGVAISAITHPPKASNQQAIDQFIGSQAFIAAARIGLLCVPEMATDATGRVTPTGRNLFCNPKVNVAKRAPTLAYRIDSTTVVEGRGRGSLPIENVAFIDWLEQVDFTADEALAAVRSSRTTPVDEFLRQLLVDGEMYVADIHAAGAARGFSADKLRGAKGRLRIQTRQAGKEEERAGWLWSLPPV